MILRVNRIQRFCLHDGPGIRTTVFLQGCPLRCWWCQNPETWEPESDEAREVDIPELVRDLERDADYWTESGGGVTVSGGEPLFQAEGVAALLEALESRGHDTAVDTSGAGEPDAVREISKHAGLWLWDVKTVTPALWREGTGGEPASLTQALDDLAWVLGSTRTPVTVRVPLVASFNASREEVSRVAGWLDRQPRRPEVEVLAGHTYGAAKGPGKRRVNGIVPSAEQVEEARRILRAVSPPAARMGRS